MKLIDDKTATREFSHDLGEWIHVRAFSLCAKDEDTLMALQYAICSEYNFTWPQHADVEEVPVSFEASLEEWEDGFHTGVYVRGTRDEIKKAVSDFRRTYKAIKKTINVDLWSSSEKVKNKLIGGDYVQCGGSLCRVAGWQGGTNLQVVHVDKSGNLDEEQYQNIRAGIQSRRAS